MSLELADDVAPPRSPFSSQQHGKPAARGIGRDAGAVDAAAGNDEVVDHGGEPSMRGLTARFPPGAAPA